MKRGQRYRQFIGANAAAMRQRLHQRRNGERAVLFMNCRFNKIKILLNVVEGIYKENG